MTDVDHNTRFLAAVNHNQNIRSGGMNKLEIKDELISRYPTFAEYIKKLNKRRHLIRFWKERQDAEHEIQQYDDVKTFVSVAPVLYDVNEKWYNSMKKKYSVHVHSGGSQISLMHYKWDGRDPIRDMDNVVKQCQHVLFKSNGSWKPYNESKQHTALLNIIHNNNVSSYNRMMFQMNGRSKLRSFAKKIASHLGTSFIVIDIHLDTNIIHISYLSSGANTKLRNLITSASVVPMTDPPKKYWYRHRGTHVWSTNGPPDCVKEWYEMWINKYNVPKNLLFHNASYTRISKRGR